MGLEIIIINIISSWRRHKLLQINFVSAVKELRNLITSRKIQFSSYNLEKSEAYLNKDLKKMEDQLLIWFFLCDVQSMILRTPLNDGGWTISVSASDKKQIRILLFSIIIMKDERSLTFSVHLIITMMTILAFIYDLLTAISTPKIKHNSAAKCDFNEILHRTRVLLSETINGMVLLHLFNPCTALKLFAAANQSF